MGTNLNWDSKRRGGKSTGSQIKNSNGNTSTTKQTSNETSKTKRTSTQMSIFNTKKQSVKLTHTHTPHIHPHTSAVITEKGGHL